MLLGIRPGEDRSTLTRQASLELIAASVRSESMPTLPPSLKRQRTSTSTLSLDVHGQLEVVGLGFDEAASEVLANARRNLVLLKEDLTLLQSRDNASICDAVFAIEAAANHVNVDPADADPRRLMFLLSRLYGKSGKLSYEFLVASLMSSQSQDELNLMNPFLSPADCSAIQSAIACVLLVREACIVCFVARLDTCHFDRGIVCDCRLLPGWVKSAAALRL